MVSTGQGVLSNNMFAYCLNNPIRMADDGGSLPEDIMLDNARKYNRGEMYFLSLGGSGSPTPEFCEKRKNYLSSLASEGITVSKGGVDICTDGSDGSRVPDDDWQPYVAKAIWTDITVTTLDAYTMPYVVMPISSDACYGADLGDKALVINWDTLESVWCIIGDKGPAWGEVSINVIWQIDNRNHMTANHASGLSNNYEIIVYPGVSYNYDWSYGCRTDKR